MDALYDAAGEVNLLPTAMERATDCLRAQRALLQVRPNASTSPDEGPGYDGLWQAQTARVAGDGCAEVADLGLMARGADIEGWLAVKPEADGMSRHNLPVTGRLTGAGRWDLRVEQPDGSLFATASGWFRKERSIGLLEGAGNKACLWRRRFRRL